MNDYISRQAAIETIRNCTEYYHNNMPTLIDKASAQTELMMLPAADAVEVVRCKDCKHADKFYHCTYMNKWNTADGFCYCGERKEE